MSLNARKIESGDFKRTIMDAGTYPARLVQVIDLGLQTQNPFKGQEKKPAHEIMLTYEFVDEFLLDEDEKEMKDKPRWLSESIPIYSLEVDKATSTKRYYALDPNEAHEGDFAALLGSPCMVTVVHSKPSKKNGRVYNNINSVSSMRDKDVEKTPELVNPSKVFSLDNPDMEIFLSIPEWIQDKIKGNLDYEGSELDKKVAAHVEDGDDNSDDTENTSTETKAGDKEDW